MKAVYDFFDWVQLQIWKRPLISIVLCGFIMLIPSAALAYSLVEIAQWPAFFLVSSFIGYLIYSLLSDYNNAHERIVRINYNKERKIEFCKWLSERQIKMINNFVIETCKRLNITAPEIFYNHNNQVLAQTTKLKSKKYGITLSRGLLKAIKKGDVIDDATIKTILAHELSHVYYGDPNWSRFWYVLNRLNLGYSVYMFLPFVVVLLAAVAGFFIAGLSLTQSIFICKVIVLEFFLYAADYFFYARLRAIEFRADIKAGEIVGDTASVANIFEKIDKVILSRGYEIREDNYHNRKIVPRSFESLVGLSASEFQKKFLDKLTNPNKTQEFRQNLLKYYLKYTKPSQNHYSPMLYEQEKAAKIYDLRHSVFKRFRILFSKEELPDPLENVKLNVTKEPILPWYSWQKFNDYLTSYNQSHPSNHARKKVLLSFMPKP